MRRSSVDFPQPDGPETVRCSPWARLNEDVLEHGLDAPAAVIGEAHVV